MRAHRQPDADVVLLPAEHRLPPISSGRSPPGRAAPPRPGTPPSRALHRSLAVALPAPPGLHSALQARIAYSRRLTMSLRLIYPGPDVVAAIRDVESAASGGPTLHLWEERSAAAALAVAQHGVGVGVTP